MTTRQTDCIGMLHVPINTLLGAPDKWRQTMGLPRLTADDWKMICGMERQFHDYFHSRPPTLIHPNDTKETVIELERRAGRLSFFRT